MKKESHWWGSKRRIKNYGDNRVCIYPGCITILRTYNPEQYCGAHKRKLLEEGQELKHYRLVRKGTRSLKWRKAISNGVRRQLEKKKYKFLKLLTQRRSNAEL